MEKEQSIKVSKSTYKMILDIKEKTKLPIKYIVEKAIQFLKKKG